MRRFKKYSWILYVLLLMCLAVPVAATFRHGIVSPDSKAYFVGLFIMALIGLFCVTRVKNNKVGFGAGAITSAFTVVFILALKMYSDNNIQSAGNGISQTGFKYVFWPLLMLSTLSLIIMSYYYNDTRKDLQNE